MDRGTGDQWYQGLWFFVDLQQLRRQWKGSLNSMGSQHEGSFVEDKAEENENVFYDCESSTSDGRLLT